MNQTMSKIATATHKARFEGKGSNMGNYSVVASENLVAVSYRGTTVALFDLDMGHVQLNTGGWYTPTTKNVINAALFGTGFSIYQKNWDWFVGSRWDTSPHVPYLDHMCLSLLQEE